MASIREQIVAKAVTVIEAVNHITVVRSPVEPLARDLDAVCVVDWVREQVTPLTFDRSEVTLGLRVSMVTRSQSAEQSADDHLVTIHAALMADKTLGGLALDVELVGAGKQRDDFEQEICSIAHDYRVTYRITQLDMTTP